MKKKPYIVLFIISIIFLGIGGTLPTITASEIATNITQIKSGNLTMTVDGGGNSNVSLMPAFCTSQYAIKKTINASAKNTSGRRVAFSIGMNITTLGNDLKRDSMKHALTTSATSCTDGLIASGNFAVQTANSDVWLIKNDYDNITNTGFCNDRTYRTEGSDIYFAAIDRLLTNTPPTLQCTNTKDKFTVNESNGNGDLTYPIGLLSADEVAFAGGVAGTSNSSYYLYNNHYTWVGSPFNFFIGGAREFGVTFGGYLYGDYVASFVGLCPVVSLNPNTTIS